MHTRLCDVLGIEIPVIGAPFGPWDSVDLATEVCLAGGLGSVGTVLRSVSELREQWSRVRRRTSAPFAVNHQPRPFDAAAFEATLEAAPGVISYHMGDPGDLVDSAHAAGQLWMQQVMDVDQARAAVERDVDVLIAQGGEAGGHSGFVSTMVLVPQVVAVAGGRPVVAAGGIADGRGLAAALSLGADGVVLGTRLLASTEMRISPEWKAMLVAAASCDAQHTPSLDRVLPPYNRPHYPAAPRVLQTPFHRKWRDRPDALAEQAATLAPALVDQILAGGGHEVVPFAGQSVGLIEEIRPAAEIVTETVRQAEAIIDALPARTRHPSAVVTG